METGDMGRVLTEATIENLSDLWAAEQGLIPKADVRSVHVKDADPQSRRLIGNPAHGGVQTLELY